MSRDLVTWEGPQHHFEWQTEPIPKILRPKQHKPVSRILSCSMHQGYKSNTYLKVCLEVASLLTKSWFFIRDDEIERPGFIRTAVQ